MSILVHKVHRLRLTVPGVGEFENRIRAARGYAGYSQKELAQFMGIGEMTLKRLEGRSRDLEPHQERFYAEQIAAICRVPVGFFFLPLSRMEEEWRPAEDELAHLRTHLDERLAALEQDVRSRVSEAKFVEALNLLHELVKTRPRRAA